MSRKRKELSILAAVIAAGCVWGSSLAPVEAVEAGLTAASKENYIAISTKNGAETGAVHPPVRFPSFQDPVPTVDKSYIEYGSPKHKYILREAGGEKYWVREGYNIKKVENNKRFDAGAAAPHKDYTIEFYKDGSNIDNAGLASSATNEFADKGVRTAVSDEVLYKVNVNGFAGLTNSPAISTGAENEFYIMKDGQWTNVGSSIENINNNTAGVTLNKNGEYIYTYNGKSEIVPINDVYYIAGKPRVFLNPDKSVYKDSVYGGNNEILVTVKDDSTGNWHTVWGTEITDYNAEAKITYGVLKESFDKVFENDTKLANDDVKSTVLSSNLDGSKNIALKSLKGDIVTSINLKTIATPGKDTKVEISNGQSAEGSVQLDVGSRVEANKDGEISQGDLTSLTINGQTYDITGKDTKLADGKNTTVAGTGTVLDPYKVNLNDKITLGGSIGHELAGKYVTIDGANGDITNGKVTIDGATGKITGVTAGVANNDAVNVGQLNKATGDLKADINTTITNTVNGSKTTVKKDNEHQWTVTQKSAIGEVENVVIKDTTLTQEGTKAEISQDGKLNITVKDTAGTIVTGSADIGAFVDGKINANNTEILKGGKLTFAGNSGETTVTLGDTLGVKGSVINVGEGNEQRAIKNVDVTAGKNGLEIKLNDTLTLGAGGNNEVLVDGVKGEIHIGTGLEMTNNLLRAGKVKIAANTINGLANTTWDAGAGVGDRVGQAATEGQLKAVKDTLTGDINSINSKIDNTITNNINKAKTEVKAKDGSLITVTPSTETSDGHTIYTVDVADMRVVGTSKTGEAVSGSVINYGATGEGILTLKHADGSEVKITGFSDKYVKAAELAGNTLKITRNDNKIFNVDLSGLRAGLSTTDYRLVAAETTDKKYVANAAGEINLKVQNGDGGFETVTIKDVASKSVVDNQFTEVNKKLGDGTMSFVGDTKDAEGEATVITKKLGEQLNITGGATGALSAGNIGVAVENGGLTVKLAKNLTGLESIKVNDITIGGKNSMDDSVITGLSNTSWNGSITPNRAATEGQIHEATFDKVSYNIEYGEYGSKRVVPRIELYQINGKNTTITNLAAGAVDANSTDAINGSQLHAVQEQINNISGNITNNIESVAIEGSNVNLKTAGGATIEGVSVTTEAKLGEDTKLNIKDAATGSLSLNMGSRVTAVEKEGLLDSLTVNGNSYKVPRIKVNAEGNPNDVLTKIQIDDKVYSIPVGLERVGLSSQNDNILIKNITDEGDKDKYNNYDITLSDNITLGNKEAEAAAGTYVNIDGNKGTITNGKVTVDGATGKITGVTAGDVSETSTDAINGSQLHAVDQKVAANTTTINNLNTRVSTNETNINDIKNTLRDSKITFTGDDSEPNEVALGGSLKINGGITGSNVDGLGKNISVTKGEKGMEIKLADNLSELQTISFATYEHNRVVDQVKIDGTEGTITGLSNTKWEPGENNANVVANRAATEGQLQGIDKKVIQNAGDITDINKKLGSGTMNFTGDNEGGKAVVALDGTLNIAGGAVVDDLSDGNNVGVVASGDGLKVKLSKKLSDIDSIVINQGGDITIGDIDVGESITNINNSITNVLKDGKLTFVGDDKVNKDVALGGKFDLTGGAGNKELSDGNIGVIATDTGLAVKLAKDVTGLTKIESTVVQGDTFKIKEGDTNNYVDITYDGDNITIGDKTVITNGTNTTVTDNNNNTWTVNQKGADGKDNKVTIKNNFIENASYADGKLTLAYNDASMQALSVDLSDLKGEIAGADFRLVGAKTTDKGYTGAYEVSKVEGQEGTIELNVMSKDSAEPEKIVLKDIASKSVVDNQFTEVNKKVDTNTTNITNITDKLGTGTMNFTGDNEGGKAVVALDGTLNIAGGAAADELSDGNNVGVVASGDGLKVKLSKKLSDIDSIVINQGGDITIGDINVGDSITKINNSITNVLKDGKMTFTGDDGQAKEVALGGELGLTGGLKDAEKLTDNNIGVIATDKGLAVKLAKDVAGLNSITSTTINGDTINSKVINVTNENGDTVKIEGDKITINNKEVITGGSENFITGDDNVKVVKTDNGYGLSLGESITVGGANKVTVNGADGVITGLTNTKWDKNNTAQYANSSKAATEAQLHQATKDAIDSAKGNDFRLVGDGDDNKGAYNVDDATGKVSLKVQDNHGNVENVIIEDIASKTVVDGINETVNKHTTEINAIDKRVTVNEGVIKGHTTIINELDKKLGEAQLSFTGDNKGGQADVLLNEKLNIAGGADTTKLANGANIGVVASADGLKLNLAKDITGLNSITTNNVYGDTIHIKNGDKYEEIKYIDGKITIGGDTIITGGGTTSLIKGDKNITIKNTKDGYNVSLNDKLDLGNGEVIIDGSAGKGTGRVQVGGSYMNKDGFYVNAGPSMTVDGINAGKKVISNVAAGKADTDAVNVGQLNQAVEDVKNSATANDQHIKGDEYAVTDNKVSMDIVDGKGQVVGNVTIKDVASTQDITNVNNRIDGLDQKVGDLNDLDADIKGDSIVDSLNKVDGRLDKVENDITDIKGDISNINKEITDIKGEAGKHSSVTGSGSIDVSLSTDKNAAGGNNYEVSLKDDVNINNSLTVGGADGVLIQNNAITGLGNTEWDLQGDYAGSDKAATEAQLSKVADSKLGYDIIKNDDGTTTVDKSKVTLAGGKDKDGKAIGTTITNLAAGKVEKDSTDAINGSQLWETNQNVANNTTNIQKLSQSISSVNGRVSKAAAGAAALAALHPLDFDPDDKLSFAAGVGNYGGSTATSIGAFYHPTEKVMLNVAGTYGNGENMVNMGVAFALDKNNNVSNSRVAMAKEIVAMREHMAKQDQQIVTQSQQIAAQNQQIAQLVGLVNRLTGNKAAQPVALAPEVASPVNAMFPDVAENHWAYEYVAKLAQAGVIDGYPDGSFYGDRTMTRYEFATMLYKAMAKGAQLDTRITDEFKFELGRIRVDLIKGEANSANSVERVRVNTTPDTNEYGDKILVAIDK